MTSCNNISPSTSTNFVFLLSSNDLKELEFRVQSFSGLGITLGENTRYWQSLQVVRPGDSMVFNEITLTTMLDEELDILEDLYEYMFRIKDFENNTLDKDDWTGTLFISTNRNNYSKKFVFYDCWIKSFSDISFNSNDTAATVLTTDLTVSFSYYKIEDAE